MPAVEDPRLGVEEPKLEPTLGAVDEKFGLESPKSELEAPVLILEERELVLEKPADPIIDWPVNPVEDTAETPDGRALEELINLEPGGPLAAET